MKIEFTGIAAPRRGALAVGVSKGGRLGASAKTIDKRTSGARSPSWPVSQPGLFELAGLMGKRTNSKRSSRRAVLASGVSFCMDLAIPRNSTQRRLKTSVAD